MALINCPECTTEVSDRAAACVKCGFPLTAITKCPDCGAIAVDNATACEKCGCPVKEGVATVAKPTVYSPYSVDLDFDEFDELKLSLSNKWAWVLAFIPIIGIILEVLFSENLNMDGFIGHAIFLALNTVFWILDACELKNKGLDDEWIWFGVLVPVYLFVRAANTNKKYGYAITWCVTFVLYVFFGMAVMLDELI